MEHFAEFLSDLKDHFYLCKNVTESIFRAMEGVPGSLRKRLERICFLLEQDAMGTTVAEEEFFGDQKYLRLFLIQCRSAIQYGSGKKGTESVFVKNMTELRRDVQNESYQRMQSMYLFAGMGVVAVAPVVCLPLLRWFGTVTMEEMEAFYESRLGETTVVIFWLLTIGSYMMLCMIRQTDKRIYRKPRLVSELFSWGNQKAHRKGEKKSRCVKKAEQWLSEAGIDAAGALYWLSCGGAGTAFALVALYLMRGAPVLQLMLGLFIGIGIGFILMMGVYRYMAYLRRLGMEGEVLNLQAAVLLLIDVPNITLMDLLDVLGSCGEIFQKPLLCCADSYVAEEETALKNLYEAETSPAFRQLAGRLLASERIGIRAAFAELEADRHFFREQLRLDMEQERKKKAANAQVVAFLPMMFLLFAYLILPFLGISLGQMGELFREMEQLRLF
ncbi:MAG: hypothetical protein IJZ55_10615 [Lachnospiraceae bacterium]|nr:hypothetical protein [Lachnospiraceae bacterium]